MSNQEMTTDKTLAMRFVHDGDETAFDALVERYSGKMYQVALGVLNSREDAEEITQDTFIRVYRSLQNFRWECEFSSWIYTIALNLARNRHRWNKIRGKNVNISLNAPVASGHDGDDLYLDVPDEQRQDPDEQMDFDELQSRVAIAMEKLPESFRTAVVLRNVQHLSYESIAEILHCQLGTVKSKINRGRELLRKFLSGEDRI